MMHTFTKLENPMMDYIIRDNTGSLIQTIWYIQWKYRLDLGLHGPTKYQIAEP